MQLDSGCSDGSKFMKDAQKAYVNPVDHDGEDKVYIPENIEEDSESDSFGERLRKMNDDGQTSKQGGSRYQIWFVENIAIPEQLVPNTILTELLHEDKTGKSATMEVTQHKLSTSPEVFLSDDNIMHTQENQAQEGDAVGGVVLTQETDNTIVPNIPAKVVIPEVRRRSERLMKETTLTTQEKTARMVKKRNLEGTVHNQNMFSALSNIDIANLTSNMGVDID